MKFKWVTLHVGDLSKSLFFYHELLGLEVAARFGSPNHEIVMLGEANESKVELIFEPGKKIENPGDGISFGLEAENLDALIARLKQSGYPAMGPIAPSPQIRFFFVKDPDGFTVQLTEERKG